MAVLAVPDSVSLFRVIRQDSRTPYLAAADRFLRRRLASVAASGTIPLHTNALGKGGDVPKRVVFQFVGGELDGDVVDSDNEKDLELEPGQLPPIAGLLWITDNAKLGGGVRGASQRLLNALENGDVGDGDAMEMTSPGYYYQITDRQETDDCLTVTMTSKPPSFQGN